VRVTAARVRGAVVLVVACAATACVDPADRRPGLRLTGEVVEEPVEDWSFTDAHPEIYIETRPPWLLPHSVTIVATSLDGELYVHARNPAEKRWVGHVARDPRVRLEIGDKIYERRLERVEDPARQEAIYRDFAAKYGWDPAPPARRPPLAYFHVVPREEG